VDQALPSLDFRHLFALTDDTGILQHAFHCIPNRIHGYCLDDNARALIVAVRANLFNLDPGLAHVTEDYLSFLLHCQREDGLFRNFMSYDRRFEEAQGSDDSFGRAIWATGYAAEHLQGPAAAVAEAMLRCGSVHCLSLKPLRSKAYAILGFSHFLKRYPCDEGLRRILESMADELVTAWRSTADSDWLWFEDSVTYANARLPQALFLAYYHLPKPEYLDVALQSTDFLTRATITEGRLQVVGNRGWWPKGQAAAAYDQQPIDAGAATELYLAASEITGEDKFDELAVLCFRWFLGQNSRGEPVYDPETGGCHDGLNADGVNPNMGAESVLAYLMARLALVTHCRKELRGEVQEHDE
jgi:hypothetical protein